MGHERGSSSGHIQLAWGNSSFFYRYHTHGCNEGVLFLMA